MKGGFEMEDKRAPLGLALLIVLALAAIVVIFGCGAQNYQLGRGSSMITGSAGPAGVQNVAPELPRCTESRATVALAEGQLGSLTQYGLTSPIPLLRLMAQQSGCFLVVDRADGLDHAIGEVELAESGMLRKGSGIGRGMIVEADYTITPHVVFKENNAGQIGAGLLGLIPLPGAALLGAVAGGLTFQEAETVLFLTDNRTGVQTAAAEGSASKADLAIGGGLLGGTWFGGAGAGLNRSWHTNNGKVVAAALLDAFRNLIPHIQTARVEKPLAMESGQTTTADPRPLPQRKRVDGGYLYPIQ